MKLFFPLLFIGLLLTGLGQTGCTPSGIQDAGVYYDTVRPHIDNCYSKIRYLDQSVTYTPEEQYNKYVKSSIDSIGLNIAQLEKLEPFKGDDTYRQAAITFCKDISSMLEKNYLQLFNIYNEGDSTQLTNLATKVDEELQAAQDKFVNVEKEWAKKNNIEVTYYDF